MRIEQFQNMCVAAIQREINKCDRNHYFTVQFEDLLSDINSAEKISATVSILFAAESSKKKHVIAVCWRRGWGIGFENNTHFQSINVVPLLQSMYLDLAHHPE